jgi:cytochrome P450
MLYPDRLDIPDHVPPELIVDYDTFQVDAPDGDFAAAMVRLRDSGVPELFWTQRNGGHWVATSGAHVRRILEDAKTFSNRAMRVPKAANPAVQIIPLMIDPPDHAHYRRLLSRAITPGAVKLLSDDARRLSIGLIEALEPRGTCEFVADFAQQMPIAIFMSMLDLPAQDRPVIMAIVDRIIRPDLPETRIMGFADLADYTMAKVRERRSAPGKDLVSDLSTASIDGRPLRDDELQGLMSVLMLAGLDTVASMLTFITRFLALNPGHCADLRARPGIMTQAIEEFLRRMAMVNLTREVARDVRLGDVWFKQGDLIVAPTALCNFPRDGGDWIAVEFDRPRILHATFGAGAHYCMGSSLARAEIRIFLEEWLPRIPDFAIAEGAGLEVKVGAAAMVPSLPLVWTPAATRHTA